MIGTFLCTAQEGTDRLSWARLRGDYRKNHATPRSLGLKNALFGKAVSPYVGIILRIGDGYFWKVVLSRESKVLTNVLYWCFTGVDCRPLASESTGVRPCILNKYKE